METPDGVSEALGMRLGLGQAFVDHHVRGGKRLRCRLVEIVAGADAGRDAAAARRYGRAIELIHAGALAHDDIMDASMLRRGRPTLWREVGVRPAVLAGTALMVTAATELADAPPSLRATVGDLLRDVARGQTDEMAHLGSTRSWAFAGTTEGAYRRGHLLRTRTSRPRRPCR
jgi:geranylgeranyl pyrophosphate synthase